MTHAPSVGPVRWPRLRRRLPLAGLLVLTAFLYLWDPDVSGSANDYYAAAAQAGARSWEAFLFGSLDPGNAITVDKTPLAIWPMSLCVRLLGLSSWSLLLPQALEGMATVAVVHAAARRTTRSDTYALLAGAVTALTPVAALLSRYDDPDTLLVLWMTLAAASTLRSLGSDRGGRWAALAGLFVGLGFLTKMGAVLLVVPALVVTVLLCAQVPRRRRVLRVGLAGLVATLGAGWWLLTVALWPRGSRPWVGGSAHDSVLEVALGYNGLGRLSGAEGASSPGDGTWQLARLGRVFTLHSAQAAGWLLPAALVVGVAALWLTQADDGTASQHGRERAVITMCLTWVVTVLVTLSAMSGIFHSYYTILLVPPTAVLLASGLSVLWPRRASAGVGRILGAALLATGLLAAVLAVAGQHGRPWLGGGALLGCGGGAIALARPGGSPLRTRVAVAVAAAAAVVAPVACTVSTAGEAHVGSAPMVGVDQDSDTAVVPPETLRLVAGLIRRGGGGYRWAAAVGGARAASAYQLASGTSVMAVGGYHGTDPFPTVAGFADALARHEVRYYVTGGTTGPASATLESWVAARFVGVPVAGVTVYDLGP